VRQQACQPPYKKRRSIEPRPQVPRATLRAVAPAPMLVAMLQAMALAAAPPPSVTVFSPGMANANGTSYACIRIPSIVLDEASSHLLAFAECRHSVGDGCEPKGVKSKGNTDLCTRVSTDQGATWGPLRTLATNAGQVRTTALLLVHFCCSC